MLNGKERHDFNEAVKLVLDAMEQGAIFKENFSWAVEYCLRDKEAFLNYVNTRTFGWKTGYGVDQYSKGDYRLYRAYDSKNWKLIFKSKCIDTLGSGAPVYEAKAWAEFVISQRAWMAERLGEAMRIFNRFMARDDYWDCMDDVKVFLSRTPPASEFKPGDILNKRYIRPSILTRSTSAPEPEEECCGAGFVLADDRNWTCVKCGKMWPMLVTPVERASAPEPGDMVMVRREDLENILNYGYHYSVHGSIDRLKAALSAKAEVKPWKGDDK